MLFFLYHFSGSCCFCFDLGVVIFLVGDDQVPVFVLIVLFVYVCVYKGVWVSLFAYMHVCVCRFVFIGVRSCL